MSRSRTVSILLALAVLGLGWLSYQRFELLIIGQEAWLQKHYSENEEALKKLIYYLQSPQVSTGSPICPCESDYAAAQHYACNEYIQPYMEAAEVLFMQRVNRGDMRYQIWLDHPRGIFYRAELYLEYRENGKAHGDSHDRKEWRLSEHWFGLSFTD